MANIRDDVAARHLASQQGYIHPDLCGVKPVSPQICTRRHVSDRSPIRTCRWTRSVPLPKGDRDRKEDEETRGGGEEGGRGQARAERKKRREEEGGEEEEVEEPRACQKVKGCPSPLSPHTIWIADKTDLPVSLPLSVSLSPSFTRVLPPPTPLLSNTNVLLHALAPTLPAGDTINRARTRRLSLMPRG